ncbi:MAG: hypothetical protein WDZ63_04120 [Burkholderiales bacterium]
MIPIANRFRDALPQALLIRGQAGIGKMRLAMHLAHRQLCETDNRNLAPCGDCPACHLNEAGNHPDLRVLEPRQADLAGEEGLVKGKRGGDQIPVDAIRGLAGLVSVTPHRSRAKVIVIAPAEAMHPSAANALLKMLEEPSARTHFILVSSQPHRVPRTILSRCFQAPIAVPERSAVDGWLGEQSRERSSLALSMSGYAPLGVPVLSEDSGFWASRQSILDGLTVQAPDPLRLAEQAEALDPRVLATLLWMWTFDLALAQTGKEPRYHLDYARSLPAYAERIVPPALYLWQDKVLQYARAAHHPLNKRLALEALFCAYPSVAV